VKPAIVPALLPVPNGVCTSTNALKLAAGAET
jgi:hypothetical protein